MAGLVLFQFQGSPLSTDVDDREPPGTIRFRCAPVSVVMIRCGLITYVSWESGHGLLPCRRVTWTVGPVPVHSTV